MRISASSALLSRRDVVVIASVSCIYGLGSPEEYKEKVVFVTVGEDTDRDLMLRKLIDIQYVRNDTLLGRGRFRVNAHAKTDAVAAVVPIAKVGLGTANYGLAAAGEAATG